MVLFRLFFLQFREFPVGNLADQAFRAFLQGVFKSSVFAEFIQEVFFVISLKPENADKFARFPDKTRERCQKSLEIGLFPQKIWKFQAFFELFLQNLRKCLLVTRQNMRIFKEIIGNPD